ncbi:MAG: DEAD/DEAH box helicase [Clostridiaceae bacterium]|nr:DEAD/DEAH box helicase [Clostridiaceae bacterium]
MDNITFPQLALSPKTLQALQDMGFEEATPIQAEAIPLILEGRDIFGQAQTGTGKTCAYGIPLIEKTDPEATNVQYLVLSPTRELAIQIADEMRELTKYQEGIRILAVYGGQPIDRQIMALKKRPQIIVGTPGRVMDHMRRKTIRLDQLNGIILDEADEMLNMGFKEDIDVILADTPDSIQRILFSATMPAGILELTNRYLHDPVHVRIVPRQMTVSNIEQFYIEVREASKIEVLCRLIEAERIKLALIFCNTKRKVDDVYEKLQTRGYSAEALHGDMKQLSRTRVMNRFRSGDVELLVATDVAARGIDVDNIEVVINYDLPQDEEYYVHRIGRTARAGRSGKAYTFVVGREIFDLKNIQRFTRSNIVCTQPPSLVHVTETRVFDLLDKTRDILAAGGLDSHLTAVEQFVTDLNATATDNAFYTTADIAAALLQHALGQKLTQTNEIESVIPYEEMIARKKKSRDRLSGGSRFAADDANSDFQAALLGGDTMADDDLDDTAKQEKKKRKKKLEPGMTRLFLNVGIDDHVQPAQIVKAICSSSSLVGKQIGAIALYGRYTFVDVPAEAAAQVAKGLSGQKIGNRPVRAEVSAAGKDAADADFVPKPPKAKSDYYQTGKSGKGSRPGHKGDFKKHGKGSKKHGF